MLYTVVLENLKKIDTGTDSPIISIIVLAYNNTNYLNTVLDSIFIQDYPNIELIISDDASEEFNVSKIESYVKGNISQNVKYCYINVNKNNMKTVAHFESLLPICHGEYITLIAADDAYYDSSVISTLYTEFKEDPELYASMGQTLMYDKELEVLCHTFTTKDEMNLINSQKYDELFYELSQKCFIPAAGIIYKKDIFSVIGSLSDTYTFVEDWTTHLRMVCRHCKMKFLDVNAIKHRDGGVSHGKQGMSIGVWENILRGMECEIFPYMSRLSDEQQIKIRKRYADRVYAYQRDKKLQLSSVEKVEETNVQESISENVVIEMPKIERKKIDFEQWDLYLRSIVEKVSSITMPYKLCKLILIFSPKVYKIKFISLCKKNKIVYRAMKKIKARINVFTEKKKYELVQKSYDAKLQNIKSSLKMGRKIKVAFFVVYDAVFPGISVFEEMINNDKFEPYIVVIPDISRGESFLRNNYQKTYKELHEKYKGYVRTGYNLENSEFLEIKDSYDLIFFSTPYKECVHPYHYIDSFLDKDILIAYMDYGFPAVKYAEYVYSTDLYSKVWVAFIDSEITLKMLTKAQLINGTNAVVVGYSKMDSLEHANIEKNKNRKKIVICPHHTVTGWKPLDISNFEKYESLYLNIANDFPNIDFIFRPHPLLFTNMINSGKWTEKDKEMFLDNLLSKPNIVLSEEGNYFDLFANSDAMIHDCSSFIGEYLFTEKPCCYLLKSKEQIKETFSPLGQECLKNYYHAFTQEDIYRFINEVVIKQNDSLQQKREDFSRNVLKENYPNVSRNIVAYIEKQMRGE